MRATQRSWVGLKKTLKKRIAIDCKNNEFVFSSISECSRILKIERYNIKKYLLNGASPQINKKVKGYRFFFFPLPKVVSRKKKIRHFSLPY